MSIIRKSHSKLSSLCDGPSHELHTVPAQTPQPVNDMSHELGYGWQNGSGSQINIVPANRILKVKEMDMRSEDRDKHRSGKDEEYAWNGSRAAMSARTVL